MSEKELESVNGGAVSPNGARYMTKVADSDYLALRPRAVWDQYHELAQALQSIPMGDNERNRSPGSSPPVQMGLLQRPMGLGRRCLPELIFEFSQHYGIKNAGDSAQDLP